MTKYKVILELEVEEIQDPPQTHEQILEQLTIVPGNYIEGIKLINNRIFQMKPKFSTKCRFGGFCIDKEQYEGCIKEPRMKNNWMCWRDGINKDSEL